MSSLFTGRCVCGYVAAKHNMQPICGDANTQYDTHGCRPSMIPILMTISFYATRASQDTTNMSMSKVLKGIEILPL